MPSIPSDDRPVFCDSFTASLHGRYGYLHTDHGWVKGKVTVTRPEYVAIEGGSGEKTYIVPRDRIREFHEVTE